MNHQAKTPNADQNTLQAQLQHVIEYDNNTNDVIWSLFGIFFAVNSVLLVGFSSRAIFPNRLLER